MKPTHQTYLPRRPAAGFVHIQWVVIVLLLVLATVVALLLINRGGNDHSSAPATNQEQIEEQLGQLQQAFQTAMTEKQDLTRIAAQAQAFTEAHPTNREGHVLLAQTRIGLEQWDRAYAALQQALSLDTQTSTFELSKLAGVCAAKLDKLPQALKHYQQAVAATRDQADSEVYAALGQLHLALNEIDLAEQMFTRAIDAPGPGDKTNYKHQAYAGLAEVAAARQAFDQALSWADRAIKMAGLDSEGDVPRYQIQKARLYMQAGRDQDAVTMLGFTWDQFPQTPWRIESARLRATLYERANQLDAAVDYLQSVTEWHRFDQTRDNKTLASFTALLAQWQIKAKRIDDANVSLHNLKILAPEYPMIKVLKEQMSVTVDRTQ